MLCEECKKRSATVHVTKIVNNQKTDKHLCSECAEHQGGSHFSFEPSFSINHLLAGLLKQEMGYGPVPDAVQTKKECRGCGCSFEEFRKTGRVGCSECYTAYADKMEPILRRIHGSSNHTGKVPLRSGEEARRRREVEKLKAELKRCIASEKFEEAASIRDKIKALENQSDEK